VAVQYLATCLAVLKFRASPGHAARRLLPCIGVAVSLWIFTEASYTELIWAAASLVVGAVLVTLTAYAARGAPSRPEVP